MMLGDQKKKMSNLEGSKLLKAPIIFIQSTRRIDGLQNSHHVGQTKT